MPRAYSYVRFSTPQQREGDSERRQIALAEAYAADQGLELDHDLRFEDLGVSSFRGKNRKSGALGHFLDAVKAGVIAAGSFLLVESLDRVTRANPWDAEDIIREIVNGGVTLVTLLGKPVEYSRRSLREDPSLSFILKAMLIRAHDESAHKSRRIREVWRAKRKGMKSGDAAPVVTARIPGWLDLDAERRPIVNAAKAEIVREIFREYLSGRSPQRIAESLNKRGEPVFGGGGKRSANPRWRSSYVRKILGNEAVTGAFTPHEMVETDDGGLKRTAIIEATVPDYFPAIVDADQFLMASFALATPSPRGRNAGKTITNILGGLARCPLCGDTMTRINKGKPPKGGEYLVCCRAKDKAGCSPALLVKYPKVEQAFFMNLEELVDNCPSVDSEASDEFTRVLAAIEGTEQEIRNLSDAFADGVRSVRLRQRLSEAQEDLARLKEQRAEAAVRVSLTSGTLVDQRLIALAEACEAETIDRGKVNRALTQLFSGVVVNFTSGFLVFRWRHGGETALFYGFPTEAEAALAHVDAMPTTPLPSKLSERLRLRGAA